jgi:type I restriction enzyme R subunit
MYADKPMQGHGPEMSNDEFGITNGLSFESRTSASALPHAYHNRAISTMQVIEELIKLAKDLDAATKRGEDMGLTDDEVAFYDALATNDSAVQAMGDAKLKVIAAELITKVRQSVTIDWTLRESARAKIKIIVKRILYRHGYPPDLQEEAVKTVLAQAELLCAEWV